MPVIAGMTYDFVSSPRVANIPDAAGDVTIQDLWDTLSEEAAKVENLDKKKFINRPLGGGKSVLSATKTSGITLVLDNMVLKFPDQVGPSYVIKRVVDGNVIAIDSGGSPIEPLISSDFTNWKNEADVSAALINQAQMEAGTFNGAVWMDRERGVAGTAFPQGTPNHPAANWTDAKTIADANNLNTFYIAPADLGYPLHTAFNKYLIQCAISNLGSIPQIDGNGQNVQLSKFAGVNLVGVFLGIAYYADCTINVGTYGGTFIRCDILNEIVPQSAAFDFSNFNKCDWRFGAALNYAGRTSSGITINGGEGALAIRNMADASNALTIDGFSGTVTIEATCTAGTINVRGDAEVVNNGGSSLVVNDKSSTRIQVLKRLLARNFWLGNR